MNEKMTLINGKAGSKKTRGFLFKKVEDMLFNNENILVLDSKEEYYKHFSKKLKDKGYNIITLNLKEPKKGNGYNPYALPYYYYKNEESDKAFELLEKIGFELFTDRSVSNDPFWENTASDLITGLSILLFKNAPLEKINLGSINVASNLSGDKLLQDYISKLNVNDPIYICTSGTLFAPTDTKGSILSVVKQKLRLYCLRENLMDMLSYTDFDIASLGKEKTAIFVIARNDSKGINAIANIFIKQVFSLVIFEKIKFNFVLDNIETINPLDNLADMIDMRSDNMNIYIGARDKEILKEEYHDKNLFANVDKIIDIEKQNFEIVEDTDEPVELPFNNTKAQYFDLKKFLEENE